MRHYTRRVFVDHPARLAAGDLVDVSATTTPCWAVVAETGDCALDPHADDVCDGGCLGVIVFAGEDDPWHVDDADEIYARFAADATQDDVDADNAAHDAETQARMTAMAAR